MRWRSPEDTDSHSGSQEGEGDITESLMPQENPEPYEWVGILCVSAPGSFQPDRPLQGGRWCQFSSQGGRSESTIRAP
jgi:hypothetical protein